MVWRRLYIAALAVLVVAVHAVAQAAPAAGPQQQPPQRPLSGADIDGRILKYRTAEVTLTVAGPTGNRLANAAVTITQKGHKFLFGCNAFAVNRNDNSDAHIQYRERFVALWNMATLPFFWQAFEPVEGQPFTNHLKMMTEWCRDYELTVRGYGLCWWQAPPAWLVGRPTDQARDLWLARIRREARGFAGLVDFWDACNDAMAIATAKVEKNPLLEAGRAMGRLELVKQAVAAEREADPKAALLLVDYDLTPDAGRFVRQCLDAGVAIDGLGLNTHFYNGYCGKDVLWDLCERFAQFGKPLHFTAVAIVSGETRSKVGGPDPSPDWPTTAEGEQRQAEQAVELYRVLFSHPAVASISWWDFSDAHTWFGAPSGLLRKDMSPKPAYDALLKLIRHEWWTGPLKLKTDASGQVRFRGFLGRYEVEAGTTKAEFDVVTAGSAEVSVKIQPSGRPATAAPAKIPPRPPARR